MFSNIKSDQNIFSYHPGLFTQREAVPHLWTLTLNKHSLISSPQLFPVNPTGHWHWFGDTHQPPFSHGCLQIAIKYGLEIMVKNEFTTILVIAKNFEINQNHRLRWQSLPSPMNPSLQMHLYWPGPVYSHFALSLHNILFSPSSSLLASVTLIEFSLFPFASGAAVVVKLYSVHKLIGKHLSRPSEISAR